MNMLWQDDLKYGPYLPDPNKPQKKHRTYLMVFVDDYSRLVLYAQFYFEQRLSVLEDCFKKAILNRGLPDTVYVDNGCCGKSTAAWVLTAQLNPAKYQILYISVSKLSPRNCH